MDLRTGHGSEDVHRSEACIRKAIYFVLSSAFKFLISNLYVTLPVESKKGAQKPEDKACVEHISNFSSSMLSCLHCVCQITVSLSKH